MERPPCYGALRIGRGPQQNASSRRAPSSSSSAADKKRSDAAVTDLGPKCPAVKGSVSDLADLDRLYRR